MPDRVFAAARVDGGVIYYVGLAVVVVILLGTLIAFYRTWAEIHEDEEPDSPQDLLESFRQAHAAGQIDDRELERVRALLSAGGGATSGAHPASRPSAAVSDGDGFGPRDSSDSAEPNGTAPRSV
jgi:hypothetical protein